MKIATAAQMRELDRIAIEERGIPSLQLMENAAAAVTAAVLERAPQHPTVAVFCGPGNNGGDGLAAARLLLAAGAQVHTVLVGDTTRLTPDAAANLARLQQVGGQVAFWPDFALPAPCDVIVDALFGVGLARAVSGDFAAAVACIHQSGVPVVACDVPSGLNADTGTVLGCAVRAACTVTFTCAKPGLLRGNGPSHTGVLLVADIGIPADLTQGLPARGEDSTPSARPPRQQEPQPAQVPSPAAVPPQRPAHQKTGLVLEGGAMRGLFTAGVLDVFMEHGIRLDAAVGVSAGACFGCNYKSGQIGRTLRYNLRFCKDKRYASWRNWLQTGDLYNAAFCYAEIPLRLDLFDAAAYEANPMEFYAVATDIERGCAVYKRLDKADSACLSWIRASASMPLASRIVELEGYKLLDGGIADSIPLQFMESLGLAKNVVIRTQPRGFIKQPNRLLPLMRASLRRYPKFLALVQNRHRRYNATLRHIRRQEKAGAAFVICPDWPLEIGAVERDPAQLQRVYDHGRAVALRELDRLQAFLQDR